MISYIYSLIFIFLGVLIFFRYRKESIVFYLVSAYFIFVGIWRILNEVIGVNLFEGVYAWIYRIISALVLCVVGIFYFKEKRISENKAGV